MKQRRVLLAGFAPFGGQAINAGWEALRQVSEHPGASDSRKTLIQLPTSYAGAARALTAALQTDTPDTLLLVGQARRPEICLERVAVNFDDCDLADNDGDLADDARPIRPGGPAAFLATVPVKAIAASLVRAGVPARVSDTAGAFVCNHAFYFALDHAVRHDRRPRVCLVHVPWTPAQASARPGTPSMATPDVAAALQRIIAMLAALAPAEVPPATMIASASGGG